MANQSKDANVAQGIRKLVKYPEETPIEGGKAPAHDEIVIALSASIGGRPLHRIGDRYRKLVVLGHDHDNPAGT